MMEAGEQQGSIHVAVAFDQFYLQPFYALAASLAHHHGPGDLSIHAITTGVDEQVQNRIRGFLEKCGSVHFYTVDEESIRKFTLGSQWTSAVYYRLFFPSQIPTGISRLIYLDSDTVIVHHLRELYNLDLRGKPVGAVYDNYVKIQPLIGIEREGDYFNSGMMLIDVPAWQRQQVSEKSIDYLSRYPERIKFVDQCALNAVLKDNWEKLDVRFNLLYSHIPEHIGRKAARSFLADKVVIHFTVQRPWNMLCRNPLRYLYYYYSSRYDDGVGRRYVDFSWRKIPAWVKIRLLEFYFDFPWVQKWWRKRKRMS